MCKKRIRKIRKELAATYTYLFHYYSFRKFISRRSVGSRVVLVYIIEAFSLFKHVDTNIANSKLLRK